MPRTGSEYSAGGLVVRPRTDGEDGWECVLIEPTRPAADGSLVTALPKGHPDPGESPQEAALREIREETGLTVEIRATIGDVRYWYQRNGRRIAKIVTFYLCDYRAGDVADHDHEVRRAWWVPVADAGLVLTYAGERDIVARALRLLEGTG